MSQNNRQKVDYIIKKIKELKELGLNDPLKLEIYFADNYSEYESCPALIKKLCNDSDNVDNTYLYKMLDLLEDVDKDKKTLVEVEQSLASELADKYLYPVVKKEEDKKKN